MRVDSTAHRHHGARGTNYTLCIGAGGLTNVKQRIWHCVQQANRTGRALLPPWAQDEPVRRGRPTIQPLSLVFDRVAWHSTLKSLGVRSVSSIGRLDFSLLNATSAYNLHKAEVLRECAQLGCTVDFTVGNLDKGWGGHAASTFFRRAFTPTATLRRAARAYLPIDLAVHMRVETDWRNYMALKHAPFLDMDQVMPMVASASASGGGRSGGTGSVYVLTGDKERLQAAMRDRVRWSDCRSEKGTERNYIWCAALEYELALGARAFIGYPGSSFSDFAMQQRLRSGAPALSYVDGRMMASACGPRPVTLSRHYGSPVIGECSQHHAANRSAHHVRL